MGILDAPSLSQAQAAGIYKRITAGQVCLVLDDITRDHVTLAIPAVELAGGHVTLAATTSYIGQTNRMSQVELIDAQARGHQIAAHGVNHSDQTSLSAANRLTEIGAKTTLETFLGTGAVSTWVYPVSTSNTTTDIEMWLRFTRALTGDTATYVWPAHTGTHFMGRKAWNDSTHAAVMAAVASARNTGSTVILYTHHVDGTNLSNGITYAELTALTDYCRANGMALLTIDEAFPPLGGVYDAGFETSPTQWTYTESGTAGIVESLADTPFTNLSGTRSLHINRPSASGNIVCFAPVAIPVVAGSNYTLSGRHRYTKGSGSGGTSLAIYEYDATGTLVSGSPALSTADTATVAAWAQRTVAATINAATKYVLPACRMVNASGDGYWDHLHFDLTANGIRG